MLTSATLGAQPHNSTAPRPSGGAWPARGLVVAVAAWITLSLLASGRDADGSDRSGL